MCVSTAHVMHIAGIAAEAPATEEVLRLTAASCSFYEKRRHTHTYKHSCRLTITDNRLPTRALAMATDTFPVPEI